MGHRVRSSVFRNVLLQLLVAVPVAWVWLPARADNLLGLYVGAGVGQSHVRNDLSTFSNLNGFVQNHTGWKALAGIRPISFLGAEIEYADFGHPGVSGATSALPGFIYSADVSQKAASAFGLLYWPLPVPILDVYGKAGISELRTRIHATASCAAGAACTGGPIASQQSFTDARFAYGAGVQVKLLGLAARAEYERINESAGSPDLYSIVLAWTF